MNDISSSRRNKLWMMIGWSITFITLHTSSVYAANECNFRTDSANITSVKACLQSLVKSTDEQIFGPDLETFVKGYCDEESDRCRLCEDDGTNKILNFLTENYEVLDDALPNRPVVWETGPNGDTSMPNIILIMADDMGFNDVSVHHQASSPVPASYNTVNIDALASAGAIFTNGYSSHATCSPSRAATLTGRYATRSGFEFTPVPDISFALMPLLDMCTQEQFPDVLNYDIAYDDDFPAYADLGLDTNETTIAEVLKGKGYHTVHIGKWHLGAYQDSNGQDTRMHPTAQGFDESLDMAGLLYARKEDSCNLATSEDACASAGKDYVSYQLNTNVDGMVWTQGGYGVAYSSDSQDPEQSTFPPERFQPDGYLTDYFTNEAVEVIKANKNRPFFLYLAQWGVHNPLQATKEDYEAVKSELPEGTPNNELVYAAMIRALDRSVLKVESALAANGIANNTIVIFTSDNGGADYIGLDNINHPHKGWKATLFEGGTRVPFFIKWPGQIPQGASYDKPVSQMDIFNTIVDMADAEALVPDVVLDSVNLMPYITGSKPADQYPHEFLFWRSGHYQSVISTEDGWKYSRLDNPLNGLNEWFYNLKLDPAESKNYMEPENACDRLCSLKLAELKAKLDTHNSQQADPNWEAAIEMSVPVNHHGVDPIVEGDEYIYWPN